jgi:DNA-binding beta-propeller fold protein YncE
VARAVAGTVAAFAIAVTITCAGCTAAAPHPAAAARTGPAGPAGNASPAQPLPARSLTAPACSTATAPSAALPGVRTAMVPVRGAPFGVAAAPGGQWAFAAVANGIDVLRAGGSLAPAIVRTIPVPGAPLGLAITQDGRYLLAADGSGAVVISVSRAETGMPGAVLGTLSSSGSTGPGSAGLGNGAGLSNSAIEVAVSPDGRFAFVTLEYADRAVVFNLASALRSGFGPADYVGSIPLGAAAVGMAISPDGRWLYATSEVALPSQAATTGPRRTLAGQAGHGTLTLIGLQRAETDPAASVVATIDAGCQPVRVITSADGSQVWVTARASDDLLCFSAARLVSDPARALVAVVRVGEAPVGLAAVRGGAQIVVADSNRFGASGATANLDVVSVVAALSGGDAVVGHVPSGAFPREMALLPGGGALLVSNYASAQVEAVNVASIPVG